MNNKWNKELDKLIDILPSSRANVRRLSVLLDEDKMPRVAMFGKYNHGKSTLLNALVGEDLFKASDTRETVDISEYRHNGIVWIDTPGLDADVSGEDDRIAMSAALEQADILCLVHNAQAGELDRSELKLYQRLHNQDVNYRAKLLLVITQIDQLDASELEQVEAIIREQLPDLEIHRVSSVRYTRGVREEREVFIQASGMEAFKHRLSELCCDLDELRRKEAVRLIRKARLELVELVGDRERALSGINSEIKRYQENYQQELETARDKVAVRRNELELT